MFICLYILTVDRTKGGATLKAPAGGFQDPKLATLFFPSASTGSSANPSSPSSSNSAQKPKKKNNGGEIAGGVVGGLALIGLIGGLAFFFIFRKRQQQTPVVSDLEKKNGDISGEVSHELYGDEYAELEGKHDYNELPTTVVHHELPADEHSVELDAKSSRHPHADWNSLSSTR
jgi:hypothetical protein